MLLVNTFGGDSLSLLTDIGMLQGDMIAEGILSAMEALKIRVPVVVRIQGTNSALGMQMVFLHEARIEYSRFQIRDLKISMPKVLSDKGYVLGDIIRLDPCRDIDTWITDINGDLIRPPHIDYYLDIPIEITQHFGNAVEHYRELLETEEYFGATMVSLTVSPKDEWIKVMYGDFPEDFGNIQINWEDGVFSGIHIAEHFFDSYCFLEYIIKYIRIHKKPQTIVKLILKRDSMQKRNLVKNLLKKCYWVQTQWVQTEIGETHSEFKGPEETQEELISRLKEIYPGSSVRLY